jgi:hypothetical protein
MKITHVIPSGLNLDNLALFYTGLVKIMPIPQHVEEENKTIINQITINDLTPQQRKKFNAVRHFMGTFLTKLSNVDYKKDSQVEVLSTELRSRYQDYDKVIDCLQKLSVVTVDESYLSQNYVENPLDAHPKAYGLTDLYNSSFQNVPVDKAAFQRQLKKIEDTDYRPDHSHTKEQVIAYQHGVIFKECTFEEPDWENWETDSDTAERVKLGIERLRQGVLNLTPSAKVQRHHSVLTQM